MTIITVQAITISVSIFNLAFVISPPIPLSVDKTSAITINFTPIPKQTRIAVSNAGYKEGTIIYLENLKTFPTSNNFLLILPIELTSESVIIQKIEIVTIIIDGFPFNPNHNIANISQLIGGTTCRNSTIG